MSHHINPHRKETPMEIPIMHSLEELDSYENGDVPGWVLITLMTIAVATAIWAVAQDRLVELFNEGLSSINPGGPN